MFHRIQKLATQSSHFKNEEIEERKIANNWHHLNKLLSLEGKEWDAHECVCLLAYYIF